MPTVQTMRELVNQRLGAVAEELNQRLAAVAEEISGLFDELCSHPEPGDQQLKTLDVVLKSDDHRADPHQLLVTKEEMHSEQQEWVPKVEPEEPKAPQIIEKWEEFWTNQEGEQFQHLEEVDVTKFPFILNVKSESGGGNPRSSDFHRGLTEGKGEAKPPNTSSIEEMKTEAEEEDCGGTEPDKNVDQDSHVQPHTDDTSSDSSEREPEGSSNNCQDPTEPKSCLHTVRNNNSAVSFMECNAYEKPFRCSECGKICQFMSHLKTHMMIHTGEKPFSCSVCGKKCMRKSNLKLHMMIHTDEKPFPCSECGKKCRCKSDLKKHMMTHTGEKLFSCPVCSKKSQFSGDLKKHMLIHTGEKPFSCSDCGKKFRFKSSLKKHMMIHTGEKPFSCSNCGKKFRFKSSLKRHMMIHTGEKPFSCSECGQKCMFKSELKKHMFIHTGEKVFSCSECGKKCQCMNDLHKHMMIHTGKNNLLAPQVVKKCKF